jgi:hypothetical protein
MLLCVLQMLFALPGFAAQFFLSPYNVLFIFGLLTARFYRDLDASGNPLALVSLS